MDKLVIYLVLFFVASLSVRSQPNSATCEECSQFNYPYHTCPGNKILCTNNPYQLQPPQKFSQICLPTAVFARPEAGPADFVNNTLHGADNIYLRSDFLYVVTDGINRWNSICIGVNRSDCKPCPYVIAYWREPEDFEDHLKHFAETSIAYEVGCDRDCFRSATRLNWTSDFTMGSGVTGHAKRGFYMNIPPSYSVAGNNHIYFHLRTVVSHEYGHFLGFAEYKVVLCPPMTEQNTKDCFMDDLIGYEKERDNPCLWDKCQYMLAYCCSTVSVEETIENFGNNATDKLCFEGTINAVEYLKSVLTDKFSRQLLHIAIIDVVGHGVFILDASANATLSDLSQSTGLTAGVYMVIVEGCRTEYRMLMSILP